MIPMRRGIVTIMVGRARKSGRRQPNGQLARTYVNPKQQVASQPHRMGVVAKFRERQEAESNFGRMMLNGQITPAMFEAGRLYAGLASQYSRVIDCLSPHPRAMDFGNVGRSVTQEMPSEKAKAITARYNAAFECMATKVARAVKEHVIMEKPLDDFGSLALLKIGLLQLVKFFGLDANLQISESRT